MNENLGELIIAINFGYFDFKNLFEKSPNLIVGVLKNTETIKMLKGDELLPFVEHENKDVRKYALKALGRYKSESYLPVFAKAYENEQCAEVRKEAVSCIRRLKSKEAIPILIKATSDKDPSVVIQAARGLVPFINEEEVKTCFYTLIIAKDGFDYFFEFRDIFYKVKGKEKKVETNTEWLNNVVVCGNAANVLEEIPDDCIHLTFTSPPYYNAKNYTKYPSYSNYLDTLEKVFKETLRVTKEGRFLVLNTSTAIVPRLDRAYSSKRYGIPFDIHARLVRMGWEFVDDIVWVKPDYNVKNRNSQFQQNRKPLAYKPNLVTEYIMVYRKKTSKLIDWDINQYDEKTVRASKVKDGFERTNVWEIPPVHVKDHPAVFPKDLCKKVLEYYSYVGDLVMDPFAGSGTVGEVAEQLNRNFFLVELNKGYWAKMKNKRKNFLFEKNKTNFVNLEDFEVLADNN